MQVERFVETTEHQRLVRIVAASCGSHADAEDAVQDAYLASLRAAVPPANLSAWVVTAATRRTVGTWRRCRSDRRSWSRFAGTQGGSDDDLDIDRHIDLRIALRTLATRQLDVVNLYYFLGLSATGRRPTPGRRFLPLPSRSSSVLSAEGNPSGRG